MFLIRKTSFGLKSQSFQLVRFLGPENEIGAILVPHPISTQFLARQFPDKINAKRHAACDRKPQGTKIVVSSFGQKAKRRQKPRREALGSVRCFWFQFSIFHPPALGDLVQVGTDFAVIFARKHMDKLVLVQA